MFYRSAHQIAQWVVRYLGELADYHFTLVHKPGTLNHADAFSQRPDHDTGILDNENVVVLGLELFANTAELLNLEQNVFTAQEEYGKWIEELQKDFPLDKVGGKWFHRGCPVILEVEELQQQLLQQYHDHPLAGHPGITNMTMNLARDFWWLTLKCFTMKYVHGCAMCQSTKPNTTRPKPPLMPIMLKPNGHRTSHGPYIYSST
jgi:hypothetical protein